MNGSIGWILLAAWDRLARRISIAFCTAKTKLILRLLGSEYGPNLRVDGNIVIRARERAAIQLGRNVTVNARPGSNLVGLSGPTVLRCLGSGRIIIGDNVGISGAVLSARTLIQIGDNVLIGGNVRIYDHDFHSLDYRQRRRDGPKPETVESAAVIIGNDVFIGANAIILKGVHIGDRSVIGAGSVVTLKEIPPDSLVAGNPARVVRSLGGFAQ